MSQMNLYQRAAQIWSVLALSAKYHEVISYSSVQKLTGLHKRQVGKNLDPIADYCRQKRLPDIYTLVVSEATGLPSEKNVVAQKILAEQNRCFVYDWFSHGCPTPEQFRKAHKSAR